MLNVLQREVPNVPKFLDDRFLDGVTASQSNTLEKMLLKVMPLRQHFTRSKEDQPSLHIDGS